MKKLLIIALLLTGCAGKRMVGVDMNNLSGTPCVDGIIYNIKQAGCEVFYWGHTKAGLKLRCSYADHDNFYTTSSFYALPLIIKPNLPQPSMPWCMDQELIVYVGIPTNEPKEKNN